MKHYAQGLRTEIESLRGETGSALANWCHIDRVLALTDKHDKAIKEKLQILSPCHDISEERNLGYRLGIRDAIGVITGEIKHIDVTPREERPLRARLKSLGGSEGDRIIAQALIEAIDSLTAAVKARG